MFVASISKSFQAGVDKLYNKCKNYGSTPTAKTPVAISTSIGTIYTDRYNDGVTKGQNDVKNSPNSYSLYTSTQYTANYNNGRSQGQKDVTSNPNGYGLYTKAQYDSHYTSGYNAGVTAGKNTIAKNVTIRSHINSTWGGGSTSRDYDIAVAIKNNGTVEATGSASWNSDGTNSISVTGVF